MTNDLSSLTDLILTWKSNKCLSGVFFNGIEGLSLLWIGLAATKVHFLSLWIFQCVSRGIVTTVMHL